MKLPGDLLYIVFPVLVLLFWIVVFKVLRSEQEKQNSARQRDVLGWILAGPIHYYLRKRKYTFTRREIVGWIIVSVLMAAAPFISRLIE
ncbi:MAG: hypothetical protein Q8J96_06775 [Rhodocyclaceae bacterium]|nr:hypothetical protein [Rhodocyclaceae bacterium]